MNSKTQKILGFVGLTTAVVLIVVLIPVIISVTTSAKEQTNQKTTTTKIVPSSANPIKEPYDPSKLSEEEKSRINCFLEEESPYEKLTEYQCVTVRGCIYKPSKYERVPTCFYNREKLGYKLSKEIGKSDSEEKYLLERSEEVKAPYLEEVKNLAFTVEYLENNIIHVKITDNAEERYEVPYKLKDLKKINKQASNAEFQHFKSENGLFYFKIVRKSDNTAIFDTSMGAFVYNNQFLQMSTKLPSNYVYGFGENNHESLAHDLNFKSWGIFGRDNAPGWGDNRNNYGFQPVYFGMENSGKSHIVLLYNSNAMEYLFTPTPSLTLRTIGGILDFYFVVGEDEPETTIQSYHHLIGHSLFPPYWSLGFQISRWGYNNLDEVKAVVQRTKEARIPQDVQYIDIEYMIGYRILTVNKLNFSGIREYQEELEREAINLVLIVDPGLVMETNNSLYVNGRSDDIYVKWPPYMAPYDRDALNKDDMISWCWPNGKIVYPDYLNEKAHDWWRRQIQDFINSKENGTDIAGLWIDMNEPSSFETNELKPWNWLYPDDQDQYPYFALQCPTNKYDDPPYRTKNAFAFDSEGNRYKKAKLSQKTLCMIAQHEFNGKKYLHYDVHNLYPHGQSIATHNALKEIKKGKRPFTLTRSNFVGTGSYASHWLGDNDSTWKHMKMSLIGIVEYSIFGFSQIGADICGFFRDVSDAEMCTRWLQVGAFHTFSRNHNANKNVDKDPAYFKNEILTKSTRDAYNLRYKILPYMYTQLYEVHKNGGTVMKSLFFEFPKDKTTYMIDEQFLLGKHILVTPVLEPGKTQVNAYFPKANWFDIRTGEKINESGKWLSLNAPLDYINVHLRGGAIIPTQDLGECLNTRCSRENDFGLLISLDEKNEAYGTLMWDDGVSELDKNEIFYARFELKNNVLSMKVEQDTYKETNSLKFSTITIYGMNQQIKTIKLNNNQDVAFNQQQSTVRISNQNIPFKEFTITFQTA